MNVRHQAHKFLGLARADVEINRAETARPIGTEEEACTVSGTKLKEPFRLPLKETCWEAAWEAATPGVAESLSFPTHWTGVSGARLLQVLSGLSRGV